MESCTIRNYLKKFSVLLVSIFLFSAGFASIQAEDLNFSSNKIVLSDDSNEDSSSGLNEDLESVKSNDVLSASIDIQYPKIGKFYMFNTLGTEKLFLSLLNKALVINQNLEVGAKVYGSVDYVKFTLYKGSNEIDSKTDTSTSNDVFNCRFYSINSFFGVYKITAAAYQNDSEICRNTISDVLFLKLGESGNKKPIPVFENPQTVWQNQEIKFDGSNSYDPDGTIQSYHWNFGDGNTSNKMNPTHVYPEPGQYTVSLTVTDSEDASNTKNKNLTVVDYDFGVWVITKYKGVKDETKLDISMQEFIDRLYHSSGSYTYKLTMENNNDTQVRFDFAKTKIGGVKAILTDFKVSVDDSTNLSEDFKVGLEFRFPYSLLKGENQPPSAEYFSARVSYQYEAENQGLQGPHDVHTWFYFGKKSLRDPGILRMKIDPYPEGGNKAPLTYKTSFLTVDKNGDEVFNRVLNLDFNPASELTITSIPLKGKINYYFGETSGLKTKIRFSSQGTLHENFVQTFIINPLPSYMKFDLTLLGERSFLYKADKSYDVTYIVNSTQKGNLVKLELDDLPEKIKVNWGLNINLQDKAGSGFIDLNMSSRLNQAKLYLNNSDEPFLKIDDFPSHFYVKGSIDVPNLNGFVEVKKYSGLPTKVSVPLAFNKWKITGVLEIHDGYSKMSFDLPKEGDGHVQVGLDTNNQAMLGLDLSVVNMDTNMEVVTAHVERIATDDLSVQWDNQNGQIQNFEWHGKPTKFINLTILVDYQSASLNISGSWMLKEEGSFLLELNKPVNVTFVDMESADFKLYGYISLYENRKISLSWQFDETGYIQIYTFGKSVGNQFDFILAYDPNGSYNYQYGCSLQGQDFINITRTIKWNTEHGFLPRIWILGDKPLPGDWTTRILWKKEWYPVPYNP